VPSAPSGAERALASTLTKIILKIERDYFINIYVHAFWKQCMKWGNENVTILKNVFEEGFKIFPIEVE